MKVGEIWVRNGLDYKIVIETVDETTVVFRFSDENITFPGPYYIGRDVFEEDFRPLTPLEKLL